MYYIISLKHTQKQDKFITLWRENNNGYCYSKEVAGLYSEFEEGYHNDEGNMPIDEDTANKLFFIGNYDGRETLMIPNCQAVWDVLKVKSTKYNLSRLIKYKPVNNNY